MTFFLTALIFRLTFNQTCSSRGISSVDSRSFASLTACESRAVTALVACGRLNEAGRFWLRDEVEGTGAGVEVVADLEAFAAPVAFRALEDLVEVVIAAEAVAGGTVHG